VSAAPPSRFNAFNAKYLKPEEIAATFIPPPQYDVLVQAGHTMVVGPRGAGKTTLLTMLRPRALEAWRGPRSEEVRAAVNFTGVLIPTDLTWRGQIDSSAVPGDPQTLGKVGVLAFTSHVLRALATTAHERAHGGVSPDVTPFLRVRVKEGHETAIARDVARAWGFDYPVTSFRGLQFAMTDRLADIGSWLQLAREAAQLGAPLPPLPAIKSLEYGGAARALIERFNAAAGEDDARWALMFDELELAPETIRSLLVRTMRGREELLIYKLSLAPYTEQAVQLGNALAASLANDYQAVQLTYPRKEDGYRFCRALLASQLGEDLARLDEDHVFGRSPFETAAEAWIESGSAYGLDSPKLERLRRAAAKDASFTEWLKRRQVGLQDRDELKGDRRASTLRRITSITLVREEFRTSDEQRERTRRDLRPREHRTVPHLYAGATSLYAMVEGNPRWFMNLVRPLADDFRESAERVDAAMQARQIAKASRLFSAMLKALPLPPSASARHPRGVLPVLDAIGSYFHQHLVVEKFTSDPPGSFVVDDRVDRNIHYGLTVALNTGAIIHLPDRDDDDDPLDNLTGHKFRLAHLLAPRYRITLTTGRPVHLSTILAAQGPSWPSPEQMVLDLDVVQEDHS
jgi:hypothetical protein